MKVDYKTTSNKERVISAYVELVKKEFAAKNNEGLRYLGMPSSEMCDLLNWGQYIKFCSAVEIDIDIRREMIRKFNTNFICDYDVDVLLGDIQKIIKEKKDEYGNKLYFPYDLVFLDFFGAMAYANNDERFACVKDLFEKQNGRQFIFLLTLNLKDRKYNSRFISCEFKTLLQQFESRSYNVENVIREYECLDTAYKHKVVISYLIKSYAEARGYKIHTYAPIFYVGYKKNPMMSFSFKLEPENNSKVKGVSQQKLLDVINLNLKGIVKGNVRVLKKQAIHLVSHA